MNHQCDKTKKGTILFFSIIALVEFASIFIYDETVFVSAGMFLWYLKDAIVCLFKKREEKWTNFVFTCIYSCLLIINVIYLIYKG